MSTVAELVLSSASPFNVVDELRIPYFTLVDYLTTEGLSEGYYVVFSGKHDANDPLHFDEVINGKRIYTDIILTNFAKPKVKSL